MITYREAVGRPLTSLEVDENFRDLAGRPSGGVDEAPLAGGPFARQGGDWVDLPASSGLADAPNDGQEYVRKLRAWAVATPPASGSSGIADAPNDGQSYVRNAQAWAVLTHPESSGGSGGTGTGTASKLVAAEWDQSTLYRPGELVLYRENLWYSNAQATGHQPGLGDGWWSILTLGVGGSSAITDPVTQSLFHDDDGTIVDVASLLASLKTQIADLRSRVETLESA